MNDLHSKNRGLGWFSAHMQETLHQDIFKIMERSGNPNVDDERFSEQLKSAIVIHNHKSICLAISDFDVSGCM